MGVVVSLVEEDDWWEISGAVSLVAEYMAGKPGFSKQDVVGVFERPWEYGGVWREVEASIIGSILDGFEVLDFDPD